MNRLLAVLASLLLVGSCTKTSPATSTSGSSPRKKLSPTAARFLAAIPTDATAVFYIDLPDAVWDMGLDMVGASGETWQRHRAALEKELSAFIGERIGLEFSKLQVAAGYLVADPERPTLAVIVGAVGGELRGNVESHDGAQELVLDKSEKATLIASKKGDLVVLGDRKSVRAAHKALASKSNSDSALVARLRDQAPGAYAGVAVDAAKVGELLGPMPVPKLDDVAITMAGQTIVATARGPKESLEAIEKLVNQYTKAGLSEFGREKAKATAPGSDTAEGIGAIVGYHYVAYYIDAVKPVVKDGTLTVGFDFAMGKQWSVAVVGILAAVAIPAFMKYMKKSKTTEARQFTKRLYDGARAHYMASDPRALPNVSVGPTPEKGACCKGDGEGKCTPDASLWTAATWGALQFSIDDPSYFSYEYKVDSSGKKFEVSAYGDLDCDGEYSTFRIHGEIDANGEFPPMPALYRERELE